ncbi:MAG: hypothetical protein DWQ06_15910 [Calditrichaeota bacterium]|nr:MAG: hypothetical protein DWQ06_15910 [Calditrichota bacterium]
MEQNSENNLSERLEQVKELVESLLKENEKHRLKAEQLEKENLILKENLKNQEIVKSKLYGILEKLEQL